MFPEGTRNKGDKPMKFKSGAARIATTAKVPILPVAVISDFKFRGKVKIVYGEPIYFDDIVQEHKNDKTNKTILDAEQQQTDTIQTVIDITDSPLSNAVNAEESQVSINHTHRIRSFQENINLVLFIVSGVFLIASIVFFIVFLSAYRNEEIYCFFWLIFSFISSVAISVWYYLNQHHIAINCIKKYGITFMITAFVLCISPFYAIASLIIGAKCTKQVFDIDASTKQ